MSLKSSRGIKFRLPLGCSLNLWARGRRLLLTFLASGRCLWRTWPGSVITALNRCASASQARSRSAGADCGRNPLRFSLFINYSTRARSRAEEKPRQAGDAYISEATVVVLATRCENWGQRPWLRRTRKAYIEEAQDDSTWSRWAVILRSWVITTPITWRESTRSAPRMMGEVGGWNRPWPPFLKTINSLVFAGFSRRLIQHILASLPGFARLINFADLMRTCTIG